MSRWSRSSGKKLVSSDLGGKEVVGGLEREFDGTILHVDYSYLEYQRFNFLEEFVARCLVELEPAPDDKEIAGILGLGDRKFIEPVTGKMERSGYLDPTGDSRVPTPLLKKAFEKKGFPERKTEGVDILWIPELNRFETYSAEVVPTAGESVKAGLRSDAVEWARSRGPLAEKEDVVVEDQGVCQRGQVRRKVSIRVFKGKEPEEISWEAVDPSGSHPVPELQESLRSLGVDEEVRKLIATLPSSRKKGPRS